jgi:hypothetical protein
MCNCDCIHLTITAQERDVMDTVFGRLARIWDNDPEAIARENDLSPDEAKALISLHYKISDEALARKGGWP